MSDLKVKKASANLSTTWKISSTHVGAYSGGKVQHFPDMKRLACQFDDTVKILDVASGQVELSLKDLDPSLAAETFVSFALHPNGVEMVSASKNGLLRHWNLDERRCVRVWKSAHSSPVLSMDYDSTGTLVATGGSDKTVQVWDVEKGYATHHFRGHSGIVHLVKFHPDPRHLLLFSLSDDCSVRVWDLNRHKCGATITDHLSPATSVVFSPDGQTFVTGGRDGVLIFFALKGFRLLKTVPVYEIIEGMCLLPHYHAPRGKPRRRLAKSFCFATAGRAGAVKVWQFGTDTTAVPVAQPNSIKTKSKGKGKKDLGGKLTCELLLTEPRGPGSIGGHVLRSDGNTGGGAGVGGAIVPTSTAALMRTRQEQEDEQLQQPARKRGKKNRKKARGSLEDAGHGTAEKEGYSGVFLLEPSTLVAITHDHNFHFKDCESPTLRQTRQVMGFNDEILDLKYIPDPNETSSASPRRRLAMATNSEHVRLVDLATFDTTLLAGHSAMVLALGVSPDGRLLATTSQDATCRLWAIEGPNTFCVGICRGHTAAIGAVCFPNRASTSLRATGPAFLATGSADMSVKLWDLRPVLRLLQERAKTQKHARPVHGNAQHKKRARVSNKDASDSSESEDESEGSSDFDAMSDPEPLELEVLSSVAAHKKDINAVAMAPNDQLLASASQDKRVALWRVRVRSGDDVSLEEAGKLTGHRRGVWCAQFSPVDKVVATGSADRSIKVWSVTTHECLQTLEGHSASVLKLTFLRGGVQLLSAGADGLLKLWTLRSNECVNTFDAHDDKVSVFCLSACMVVRIVPAIRHPCVPAALPMMTPHYSLIFSDLY
eukprot:INCI16184.1.p1 GENE.INCI16184.1~~INCI16184.1.p1  ORF type:complete len:855 (-),score=123.66 INCI16184.1:1419-3902(-)